MASIDARGGRRGAGSRTDAGVRPPGEAGTVEPGQDGHEPGRSGLRIDGIPFRDRERGRHDGARPRANHPHRHGPVEEGSLTFSREALVSPSPQNRPSQGRERCTHSGGLDRGGGSPVSRTASRLQRPRARDRHRIGHRRNPQPIQLRGASRVKRRHGEQEPG